MPGWQNAIFIRAEAVDMADSFVPCTLGHELGHVLTDGEFGPPPQPPGAHSQVSTNLMFPEGTYVETYDAPKRLDDVQNEDARADSGPNTLPALLQKK